jgi:hypothetical protein
MTQEELMEEGTVKGEIKVNTEIIKDTPFIVLEEEGGFYGLMGKYRLTEVKKNKDEVINEVTELSWNNIIKVMMIVNDINIGIEEMINEKTK